MYIYIYIHIYGIYFLTLVSPWETTKVRAKENKLNFEFSRLIGKCIAKSAGMLLYILNIFESLFQRLHKGLIAWVKHSYSTSIKTNNSAFLKHRFLGLYAIVFTLLFSLKKNPVNGIAKWLVYFDKNVAIPFDL